MTALALRCGKPQLSRSLPESKESGLGASWGEGSGGTSHRGRRSMIPWGLWQAKTANLSFEIEENPMENRRKPILAQVIGCIDSFYGLSFAQLVIETQVYT